MAEEEGVLMGRSMVGGVLSCGSVLVGLILCVLLLGSSCSSEDKERGGLSSENEPEEGMDEEEEFAAEVEPNEEGSTATPLVVPGVMRGTSTVGDVDYFSFQAEETAFLNFHLAGDEPNHYGYYRVEILRGDEVVAANAGYSADLGFVAPYAGEYLVRIQRNEGGEEEPAPAYSLRVERRDFEGVVRESLPLDRPLVDSVYGQPFLFSYEPGEEKIAGFNLRLAEASRSDVFAMAFDPERRKVLARSTEGGVLLVDAGESEEVVVQVGHRPTGAYRMDPVEVSGSRVERIQARDLPVAGGAEGAFSTGTSKFYLLESDQEEMVYVDWEILSGEDTAWLPEVRVFSRQEGGFELLADKSPLVRVKRDRAFVFQMERPGLSEANWTYRVGVDDVEPTDFDGFPVEVSGVGGRFPEHLDWIRVPVTVETGYFLDLAGERGESFLARDVFVFEGSGDWGAVPLAGTGGLDGVWRNTLLEGDVLVGVRAHRVDPGREYRFFMDEVSPESLEVPSSRMGHLSAGEWAHFYEVTVPVGEVVWGAVTGAESIGLAPEIGLLLEDSSFGGLQSFYCDRCAFYFNTSGSAQRVVFKVHGGDDQKGEDLSYRVDFFGEDVSPVRDRLVEERVFTEDSPAKFYHVRSSGGEVRGRVNVASEGAVLRCASERLEERYDYNAADCGDQWLSMSLGVDGPEDYLFAVFDFGVMDTGESETHQVHIHWPEAVEFADAQVVEEVEANNSVDQANPLDRDKVVIYGVLDSAGDYFAVDLNAGDLLYVNVGDGRSGPSGAVLDAALFLYDESGDVLAMDDDGGEGSYPLLDLVRAPEGGRYYVAVKPYNFVDFEEGEYRAEVFVERVP